MNEEMDRDELAQIIIAYLSDATTEQLRSIYYIITHMIR